MDEYYEKLDMALWECEEYIFDDLSEDYDEGEEYVLDDEVLENAIKCYEITMEEPLSNVTYCFLKELKEYRELGTLEELEELINEQI